MKNTHLLASSGIAIITDGGIDGGKGYFGVMLAAGATVIPRIPSVARGDPRNTAHRLRESISS
jgi:hypothetical protein